MFRVFVQIFLVFTDVFNFFPYDFFNLFINFLIAIYFIWDYLFYFFIKLHHLWIFYIIFYPHFICCFCMYFFLSISSFKIKFVEKYVCWLNLGQKNFGLPFFSLFFLNWYFIFNFYPLFLTFLFFSVWFYWIIP
jgi:hypothetical protein